MSILLICAHASGQITLNARHIGGVDVPQRNYAIENHQVVLDGYPDGVLHHDADALLALEGYRMPTPDEQDRFLLAQRGKGMIQEVQGA